MKEKKTGSFIINYGKFILFMALVLLVSAVLLYLTYQGVAQSGADAMEVYRADHGKIDLVILDMIMPGMGGGEILDRMKAVHADCRVILSSGYSINGEAKAILARGARLFLQKPFRLDDLSQKIREALGDRK